MQLSTNKISGCDFSLQYGCGVGSFLGSSEILSNQLKLLCNKSHRVTEGTEVRVMLRRCEWYKEGQRCSVQLPDALWDKRFTYKLLIELQTISVTPRSNGVSVTSIALYLIILRPLRDSV